MVDGSVDTVSSDCGLAPKILIGAPLILFLNNMLQGEKKLLG